VHPIYSYLPMLVNLVTLPGTVADIERCLGLGKLMCAYKHNRALES